MGATALIDFEDKALVEEYGPWYPQRDGYATTHTTKNGKKSMITMHRLVSGIADDPNLEVDHVNGNPLDNRKTNLFMGLRKSGAFRSLQSRRQKCHGKVDRRGVRWHKQAGKYQVLMCDENGRKRSLGLYHDLDVASRVYEEAWVEMIDKLEAIVKQELREYQEGVAMQKEDRRV